MLSILAPVTSLSCACLVFLGMARAYRYFASEEPSSARRPSKRRRLSSPANDSLERLSPLDAWQDTQEYPILRTQPWRHAPEDARPVHGLLPLHNELEDIILATAAPKLAEALSGIVLPDIESFLADLDEQDSAEPEHQFNSAGLVRRIAMSDDYLNDLNVLTRLFERCQGITEIAAPSSLFSLLFQQHVRHDHSPSHSLQSRSPLAPKVSEAATDLSLVMLSGEMPLEYESFSSGEECDKLAAQRIKKIVFAQPSEYTESLFQISASPITFFDTFKNLTHLAFRVPTIGDVRPADLVANPLIFGEQLECVMFLESRIRGYTTSPDEYTEAHYRKEVLMTHIFSDRRCLYLSDVPEHQWLSEDDDYLSWWSDQTTDIWEDAKLATGSMASTLLETMLGDGLHVSDHADIENLSRLLSTANAQETCQVPLRLNDRVPGEILSKLVIDPGVPVTSASAQGMKLVMDTLGSSVQDFELSYSWYEEIFDAVGSAWSNSSEGGLLRLSISRAPYQAKQITWPSRRTKSSSRVTWLSLTPGLEEDSIDYQWEALPKLSHLVIPAPISKESTAVVANCMAELKRLLPGFDHLSLHPSLLESATDVYRGLEHLADHDIKVDYIPQSLTEGT